MNVSACNRIDGTVAELRKGKATTDVRLTSDLGDIQLVVTSSAIEALALAPGDRVSALFREVDVMLISGAGAISICNRFPGKILDIKKGTVTAELPVDVGGGRRIVAVVARAAVEEMKLAVGDSVVACVREGDLLLAKGDALSIRNRVAGTITNLRPGTVTTEITIATANGEVYALLARSVADGMKLAVGERINALMRERDFLVQRLPQRSD